jgi:methionine-rich copper-binding protein CopC
LTGTSPVDHATGVDIGANLVLTFNEAVKGFGKHRDPTSDGSVVTSIAVTDAVRSPFRQSDGQSNRRFGAGYSYATLGSGVVRPCEQRVRGISTTWVFSTGTGGDATAPLLTGTSPADDATGVAVGTNLVLTFNEPVKAGAGHIVIWNAHTGVAEKFIPILDATQVSFSGNQLTINSTTDLSPASVNYVTFNQSTVVLDLADNPFGLLSNSAFNFS